jgi:tetratricopeptide (TPR) repeat protein
MDIEGFVASLRQRRVFRVAAAYAVAAFALLQAADIVFPALGVPTWAMTLLVIASFLGFPVALVLAWVFDVTPAGVIRTTAGSGPAARLHARAARIAAVAVSVTAVLAAGWYGWSRAPAAGDATPDAGLVVVAPFRTAGAEPALAYLREGMVDLLAAKFDGRFGPRSVDPRTSLVAWRHSPADPDRAGALATAARLGAGQLLLGEIVSAPPNTILTAELLRVPGGRSQARATVEGPADSLPALVDRLVAALLSLEAGEADHRITALTSTSLPALQSYLIGEAARRQGNYAAARLHFERALEQDSLFALAAINLERTASWISGLPAVRTRAIRLAWDGRARLSPRDRAYLEAVAGPRYPDPSTAAEFLSAWEMALEAAPDRAEIWEEFADMLFHFGNALAIEDADRRAEAGFLRAVEIDPTRTGALHHLVQLAGRRGDAAATRGYADLYLAGERSGDGADYVRWRAHRSAGPADGSSLDLADLGPIALLWISLTAQEEGFALADAERAVTLLIERAATRGERMTALSGAHQLAMNGARIREAQRFSQLILELEPGSTEPLGLRILAALYWDGDTDAAAAAGQILERAISSPLPADPELRANRLSDLCVVSQWRLARGVSRGIDEAIATLRSVRPGRDPARAIYDGELCAAILEAQLSAAENRADRERLLEKLEARMLTFPPTRHAAYANLVVARLHESAGRPDRALSALRRRPHRGRTTPAFLSTFLREEARTAELVGDRAGAIRANRHLLALRPEPDEAHRVTTLAAREALARLEGARPR